MRIGDLVRATTDIPSSKTTRRAVFTGEVGVLVKTLYINNLNITTQLWCEMLMHDGVITVPTWCVESVVDESR